MARPKGSKNKKTIMTVEKIEAQAAEKLEQKAAVEAEMQNIQAEMDKQKQLLKAKKKEMRAVDKALAALEEKRVEAQAIEEAAAKKKEIEKVVTTMISSGKSAEEILNLLNK